MTALLSTMLPVGATIVIPGIIVVILVIVLLTEILRGSEPMQADEAVVVIHD